MDGYDSGGSKSNEYPVKKPDYEIKHDNGIKEEHPIPKPDIKDTTEVNGDNSEQQRLDTNDSRVNENEPAIFKAIEEEDTIKIQDICNDSDFDKNIWNSSGITPLAHAVSLNKIKMVELLLDADFELNATSKNEFTPLHWAVIYGRRNIVNLLLDKYADINIQNSGGDLPLHLAVQNKHYDIVKKLIDISDGRHEKNCKGKSPIYLAIEEGNGECIDNLLKGINLDDLLYESVEDNNAIVVRYLLEKSSLDPSITLAANSWSALHATVAFNNIDSLKVMTEFKADFNAKDNKNCTPLYLGVEKKNLDGIKLLLKAGCNVDIHNGENSETALYCAAGVGEEEIVRVLLQYGANPRLVNELGKTPLHHAIDKKKYNVIKYLMIHEWNRPDKEGLKPYSLALKIEHKDAELKAILARDLNQKNVLWDAIVENDMIVVKDIVHPTFIPLPGDNNWFPIHLAAHYNRPEMIKIVADKHWNLDVLNDDGDSALHLAAKKAHCECIAKLFKLDFRLKNKEGQNSLHCAVKSGQLEAVKKVLVTWKAPEIDAMNSEGLAAVHLAAIDGHNDILQYFKTMKANMTLKSNEGYSCLYYAKKYNHTHIVDKHDEYGWDMNEINDLKDLKNADEEVNKSLDSFEGDMENNEKQQIDNSIDIKDSLGPETKDTSLNEELHQKINDEEEKKDEPLESNEKHIHQKTDEESITKSNEDTPLKDDELLIKLVKEEDLIKLQMLLNTKKVNPCSPGLNGWNAFHYAVSCKNPDIVVELLKYAEIGELNIKNDEGETPLHLAVIENNKSMVETLLAAKIDPNIEDNEGYNLGHLVAFLGHAELIEIFKKYKVNLNKKYKERFTPLYFAAEQGQTEVVSKLIEADCDVDARDEDEKWSPLHAATREGHAGVVSVLLKGYANADAKDTKGELALHVAVRCKKPAIVKLLGKKNNGHVRNDDGETALYLAVDGGDLDTLDAAIEASCSVAAQCGRAQSTALQLAAARQDEGAAERLLAAGAAAAPALHVAAAAAAARLVPALAEKLDAADLNREAACGRAPLHAAVELGDEATTRAFLEAGCDVDKTTSTKKQTALHLAADGDDAAIVRLLLSYEANSKIHDADGMCPIHLAAIEGYLDVIKELKADVHLTNASGQKALDLATAHKKTDVIRFLTKIEQTENKSGEDRQTQSRSSSGELLEAVLKKDEEAVERLLAEGCDVNETDEKQKSTAMHVAAREGHVKIARLLLKSGANTILKDIDGMCPIHLAAAKGHLDILRILNADVNLKNKTGKNALEIARKYNKLDVIKFLEKNVNNDKQTESRSGEDRQTQSGCSLDKAVLNNDIKTVKQLLDDGCDVNQIFGRQKSTALHLAAKEGHVEVAKLLLQQGANTKLQDIDGYCPIHVTAIKGHLDIVKLLIKDVDLKNKLNKNALELAKKHNKYNIIEFLDQKNNEKKGKNAKETRSNNDTTSNTSLHEAVSKSNIVDVERLLKKGGGSQQKNEEGLCPLHVAASAGNVDLVKLFIEHDKNNLNLKCGNNYTALFYAIDSECSWVTKILLENGCDVNMQLGEDLSTVLHYAVEQDMFSVVKQLLDHNADAKIKDKNGLTPLDVANKTNKKMMDELRKPRQNNADIENNIKRRESEQRIRNNQNHDQMSSSGFPNTLYDAVFKNDKDTAEKLLKNRHDVNEAFEERKWTALHLAANKGYLSMVRLLLQHNANTELQDKNGKCPMDLATANGHLEIKTELSNHDGEKNKRENFVSGLYKKVKGVANVFSEAVYGKSNDNSVEHKHKQTNSLHDAVKRNNKKEVEKLLKNGCDVNKIFDKQKSTALHVAAREGNVEIANLLLSHEADSKLQDIDGMCPIHVAAIKGHLDVVKILQKDVDLKNKFGKNALELAVKYKKMNVIDFLLENVNNNNENHNEGRRDKDNQRQTRSTAGALYEAVLKKDEQAVERLLQQGCAVNEISATQELTAIHVAARDGHVKIARMLLKSGADTKLQDANGMCPIHLAAANGHLDIVRLLNADVDLTNNHHKNALYYATMKQKDDVIYFLNKNKNNTERQSESGRDEDRQTQSRCSLDEAVLKNDIKTVKQLLEDECDVNQKFAKQKFTALHLAAREGHVEVAKLLLEQRANTKLQDVDGMCPIHVAAIKGQLDIVKLLIRDVNLKNKFSKNALELAKKHNKSNIIEFLEKQENNDMTSTTSLHEAVSKSNIVDVERLLKKGGGSQQKNEEGLCPLHVAASAGNVDLVKLFIEHDKNNLNLKCGNNYTALFYAIDSECSWVTKILLENGCDVNMQLGEDLSTVLHYAVENDMSSVVKQLLDHKADPNIKDQNGLTAVSMAKNPIIVEEFKKRGFHNKIEMDANMKKMEKLNSEGGINAIKSNGDNALHEAVRQKDNSFLKFLLENKIDSNIINKEKMGAIHMAVINKEITMIDTFIEHKANMELGCGDGFTPLYYAVLANDETIVAKLLKYGCTMVSKDKQCTALHVAAANGLCEMIKLLLDNNMDETALDSEGLSALHIAVKNSLEIDVFRNFNVKNKNGLTPLYMAVEENGLPKVFNLLKKDSDPNIGNGESKWTALHLAAAKNYKLVFKSLLENPKTKYAIYDALGMCPLHYAVKVKSTDIIKEYKKLDLDINVTTKEGSTCLHIAAGECDTDILETLHKHMTLKLSDKMSDAEIINFLVKNGANINKTNNKGLTPLHLSVINGRFDVFETLISCNADRSILTRDNKTLLQLAEEHNQLQIKEKINSF